MTNITSGNQEFINSLMGNTIEKVNSKFIVFYKTFGGLGLLISKAQVGSYVEIANNGSSSIKPDIKFPSSKSNCTGLNNWHIIFVTWSKGENLSNCWSNGEKMITLVFLIDLCLCPPAFAPRPLPFVNSKKLKGNRKKFQSRQSLNILRLRSGSIERNPGPMQNHMYRFRSIF